jgi:hypothetical protein
MSEWRQPWRVASIGIAGVLFAVICYRAATQSVVHDEAFAWQALMRGPDPGVFRDFRENNHFLQTVLSFLSVRLFGDSGLALRLPSILAGGWFLFTAVRLAGLLFGSGFMGTLLVWLLGANPLVLDFFVAARGYGLALALLFWALYRVAEILAGAGTAGRWPTWRPLEAGAAVALSVAANLAFLIPAVVLVAAFAFVLKAPAGPAASEPAKGKKKPGRAAPQASVWALPLRVTAGAALAGTAFLVTAPLETAKRANFYAGAASLADSLRSVASSSFAHGPGIGGVWGGLGGIPALVLGCVLALLLLAAGAESFGRRAPVAQAIQSITAVTVAGAWILWVAGHYAAAMPYPQDRSGLFFVPLALLAVALFARGDRPASRWPRFTRAAACFVLMAVASSFAIQWNVSSFLVWRYDADTPRLIEYLHAQARPGRNPVRLGASWQLVPSLEYYRQARGLAWLAPVEQGGPDGDFDFYALIAQDRPLIAARALRPAFRGTVSGTVLAERAAR